MKKLYPLAPLFFAASSALAASPVPTECKVVVMENFSMSKDGQMFVKTAEFGPFYATIGEEEATVKAFTYEYNELPKDAPPSRIEPATPNPDGVIEVSAEPVEVARRKFVITAGVFYTDEMFSIPLPNNGVQDISAHLTLVGGRNAAKDPFSLPAACISGGAIISKPGDEYNLIQMDRTFPRDWKNRRPALRVSLQCKEQKDLVEKFTERKN